MVGIAAPAHPEHMRWHDDKNELRQLDLFRQLDRRTLALVGQLTTEIERPAGTVWMFEGHWGQEALIVLEGEAVVTVGGREIGVVGPGDVIGERSLMTHEPRSATVVARTPMRVLALSRREFQSLLAGAPEVAQAITKTMAAREGSTPPPLRAAS